MRKLLTVGLGFLIFGTLITGCGQQSSSGQSAAAEAAPSAASAQDIRTEEITYQVGDTTLSGYLVYDAASEPRPGVLVVHEWWGHNEYVRTRAYMLAKLGYSALALDMYGDGKVANHPDDAQKFMNEVMSNADLSRERFVAAMKILQQHPSTQANKIAAIGYCMGGGIVLNMARNGMDLKGVASFHGTLGAGEPAQAGAIQAKILVAHGADDPFVPAEQVDAFKAEMDAAGVDYRFIAYPGAVHGFTNPGATALGQQFNLPLAYNQSADEQSWDELKKFLAAIFE